MSVTTTITVVSLSFFVLIATLAVVNRDIQRCNATNVAHQVLPK